MEMNILKHHFQIYIYSFIEYKLEMENKLKLH